MTPEEAQAFSEGEFRGRVLTQLDSIQNELSEHKIDHKRYYNGHQRPMAWTERAKASVLPLGSGAGLMGLAWAFLERL